MSDIQRRRQLAKIPGAQRGMPFVEISGEAHILVVQRPDFNPGTSGERQRRVERRPAVDGKIRMSWSTSAEVHKDVS